MACRPILDRSSRLLRGWVMLTSRLVWLTDGELLQFAS